MVRARGPAALRLRNSVARNDGPALVGLRFCCRGLRGKAFSNVPNRPSYNDATVREAADELRRAAEKRRTRARRQTRGAKRLVKRPPKWTDKCK